MSGTPGPGVGIVHHFTGKEVITPSSLIGPILDSDHVGESRFFLQRMCPVKLNYTLLFVHIFRSLPSVERRHRQLGNNFAMIGFSLFYTYACRPKSATILSKLSFQRQSIFLCRIFAMLRFFVPGIYRI